VAFMTFVGGDSDHKKLFYFNIKQFLADFGVEMILDKIRVSKWTTTASKRPHSRR